MRFSLSGVRRVLVSTLLLALLGSTVHAQEHEGVDWLSRMVQSFSTLDYEGVFVRSQGIEMNSMKVRHGLIEGVEYESLVDLDGQKVEIIRIDSSVICVYPDASFANNAVPVTTPFKAFRELNGDRLLHGYDFKLAGSTWVAGREAQKILLLPKDQFRYGHEFWLDEETGFLLKHDTLDNHRNVLDRVQFTSLNLSPDLHKSDFQPSQGSYAQHLKEMTPKAIENEWQFDWLPEGFAPVWRGARVMPEGVVMMLLSDGVASMSVFIEKAQQPKALSLMSMGPTVAGSRTVVMDGHLFLLTLVGEVPEATVTRVLSSVMPRKMP